VRLKLREGGAETGSLTWTAGAETRRTAFSARGGEVVVGLPQWLMDEAWLTAPSVDAIRVDGVELAEPPALRRAPAAVVIKSPKEYDAVALTVFPRARFASEAPAAAFRVMLEWDLANDLRIQLPWTKKASDLARKPDGDYVFVIDQPADPPAPKLDWPGIREMLGPGVHRTGWVLPLRLVIEALDDAGGVIGRSSFVRLGLFAVPPVGMSEDP
jgi:hypothetical protein